MPAEVVAPEKPVAPPSPVVEVPQVPIDQAKLNDLNATDKLGKELSGFIKTTSVQGHDVKHDGQTVLEGHKWRVVGEAIEIEGTSEEFENNLHASIEDAPHWSAVWFQRMAKIWHKIITFGKSSQG